MRKIKIAIIGVGNCASALLQGIHHYSGRSPVDTTGLMHPIIGHYEPSDIEVVAAFDIDARKVGKDISQALFSPPNCCVRIADSLPDMGVTVGMGSILDGLSSHMTDYPENRTFQLSPKSEASREDIVSVLKESEAEIMLNYLPVGSDLASKFYAECALSAGLAFVNNIPVFIASDSVWENRFKIRGLPILGDDIKSQMGATIVHRVLSDLFEKRGVKIDRTYQLNVGGNTDFLNMMNRDRLKSKKISKTEAVQSVLANNLDDCNIHVGPSDYVPWLNDNKICFVRIEGRIFGGIPIDLELRLSVEDSPNSAGVAVDAIRCCKLALDNGIGGVLEGPSAYFMKRPPVQFSDDEAFRLTEAFILKNSKSKP